MPAYRLVLFLHLLTVVVLLGGTFVFRVGVSQLRRARRVEQVVAWLRSLGVLKFVFPIGIVALYLTGGYMAGKAFHWTDGWVVVAAVSLLAIHLIGSISSARTFKAIGMALRGQQEGPVPPQARQPLRAQAAWNAVHVNLGIVTGVMWAMVTKPSGWTAGLVVLAMATAGLAVARLTSPRQTAAASEPAVSAALGDTGA